MSEADHKRPRRRAAGWLLAGILLLALCGAMAAFQASTAGSAASVVPNPRGQPFGSLSAAAVSAMASNESPTAADAEGVDWDYWRVVNLAIVAWVSVDGTAIDYAVVQAPGGDPDYYLSHDIYRSWNPYGCPYVDAACDGVGGMSAVVFGHNMGGGFVAMFADFARYSDEAFARSHPTIELQTPNGAMELSVSAVDVIDGSENAKRTDFSSADEMRAWYAQRFEECDVRISNDENASQLFTFVTCSYTTYANERTLVYAQPAES